MTQHFATFPQATAGELTNWQREDMRRAYPNTTLNEDEASTEIWPRSRLSDERQKEQQRRVWPPRVRQARRMLPRLHGARVISTRPILRESLKEQLVARMTTLMQECLSWASTSPR